MKAPAIHYILKDHLGSWTTITDAEGTVEQELSFDAWGNLRDPETWSGSYSGTPFSRICNHERSKDMQKYQKYKKRDKRYSRLILKEGSCR